MNDLLREPQGPAAANELRRCSNVFFVGGELPVNDTLQTMYESCCEDSTELFYLTFGPMSTFHGSEEMARQIKKNFHARLMARLDNPAPTQVLERIYAAGVDILDIPLLTFEQPTSKKYDALISARHIFPRWSVTSTLMAGAEPAVFTMNGIDALLKDGIVPLVALGEAAAGAGPEAVAGILQHLASGWESYEVPIKPLLPMVSFMTPLRPRDSSGLLRGLIDRFHDRRLLVASDLRRHLRVQKHDDSMDSAAL